jgi:hypothetical protein
MRSTTSFSSTRDHSSAQSGRLKLRGRVALMTCYDNQRNERLDECASGADPLGPRAHRCQSRALRNSCSGRSRYRIVRRDYRPTACTPEGRLGCVWIAALDACMTMDTNTSFSASTKVGGRKRLNKAEENGLLILIWRVACGDVQHGVSESLAFVLGLSRPRTDWLRCRKRSPDSTSK